MVAETAAAAAVLGLATGILPTGSAEAVAVALGFVDPPGRAALLVVAFTLSHVAAKLPWYWAGRHADRITHPRVAAYVAKARALVVQRSGLGAGIVALSAVTSLPPFHLVTIASGIVGVKPWLFVLLSVGGRMLRFGALAAAPGLVRAWL